MIFFIQPVFADAGYVSISYRGSGGYYIGDTITFDGKNTAGNTTVVKITGPGLLHRRESRSMISMEFPVRVILFR